jgi:DNA polymerase III epsilon subunit family exonuclease
MSEQTPFTNSRRAHDSTRSRYHLISDLELVNDAVAFLSGCGGRARAVELANAILYTNNLDAPTAEMFISELIEGDTRLRLAEERNRSVWVELVIDRPHARALRETEFVVVDVETTGAKAPPCRVTEIGAYRIRRREIVAEFHTLINPQMPIPPFITELTGITNAMVENAPVFDSVAAEWLNFIGASILVAHNAAFDMHFLNHEVGRKFPNQRMANAHLCTVKLARRALPELPNHRLQTLADHFSVPIINRHRARDDAHATAKIFIRLLELLEQRGARTCGDLMFNGRSQKSTDNF